MARDELPEWIADAERWPVSDAQRAEHDRCLEAFERDPKAGVSWETLKRSLENK
jgi:putative addiction module component (TIGR02574 family)